MNSEDPAKANPDLPRRHFSLHTVLFAAVTTIIVLLALANIFLLRKFSSSNLDESVQLVGDGLVRVAREKIDKRLTIPRTALGWMIDNSKSNLQQLHNAKLADGLFNYRLAFFPDTRAIYYALEDGTYFAKRRQNRKMKPRFAPFYASEVFENIRMISVYKGSAGYMRKARAMTFPGDWRMSAGYKNAAQAGKMVFTGVHPLEYDFIVGISVTHPIVGNANDFWGVIGLDISLESLSDDLNEVRPTPNSRLLIVERSRNAAGDDLLVAASNGIPVQRNFIGAGAMQLSTSNCEDSITRMGMEALRNAERKVPKAKPETLAAFTGEQTSMRVFGAPIPNIAQLDWDLVAFLPEEELLGQFAEQERRVILLYSAVLAVFILLAWIIGRQLTRPLQRLRNEARSISEAGISALREPPPASPIAEISDLSDAFNRMENRIQESLQTLEQRVRDRTRELDAICAHADQALNLTKAGYWSAHIDGRNEYQSSDRCNSVFGDPPSGDMIYPIEHWLAGIQAVDPSIAETTFKHYIDLCEGGTPLYDCTYPFRRHADGETRWIRSIAVRLNNSGMAFPEVYGVVQDITDVIENRRELEAARKTAEQASRLKSEFLAKMSHEIRTPMNAILGYSQIMSRDQTLPKDQRDRVSVINRAGEHLLSLINDILEMSKIEAGHVTRKDAAFDLHSLLRDLVDIYSGRALAKGISLILDQSPSTPRHIVSDESKLRQTVVNLLGNAVKFTSQGRVTLSVEAEKQPGDSIILSFTVTDTGPGLSSDEIQSLFRPFVQSTAGTKMGGTGLGLAISRQYARLLGGDITVQSEPGAGASFKFTAIVSDATEAEAPQKTSLPRVQRLDVGQTARVLIVDDVEANSDLLAALLNPLGFITEVAKDGIEAVERFDSWRPDAILMDMCMPVMDGYEAIRRIRAQPKGKSIVIVGLTASAFEEHRAAVLACGADEFMRKPFDQDVLIAFIGERLGLRYVYARNDDTASTSPRGDFTRLPQSLREKMQDACKEADYSALLILCDQIETQGNPDTANEARALVLAFDYVGLSQKLSPTPDIKEHAPGTITSTEAQPGK